MNSSASFRGIASRTDRPIALIPYMTPKLTVFAIPRCAFVTSPSGTLKICAATAV